MLCVCMNVFFGHVCFVSETKFFHVTITAHVAKLIAARNILRGGRAVTDEKFCR